MASGRRHFDYIVVGCGGIGSGAVYWLSKRAGNRVLGLEQFNLGHINGGSQDHSRIIRLQYHDQNYTRLTPDTYKAALKKRIWETANQGAVRVLGLEQFNLGHINGGSQDHSRIIRLQYHDQNYTRLTPDTYKAWEEVERESGMKLVIKTGGLQLVHKSEMQATLDAYAKAMDDNNIPYERWSGSELHRRYPQFTVGDEIECLYQKDGGLVDAALGNATHIQLARGYGAEVIDNCPVTRIGRDNNGRTFVETPKGRFTCRRIVVTSGAWINHVLGSVGVHIPIMVTQEQVTYFATPNMKQFSIEKFPMYIYSGPNYDVYGLPIYGNSGVKIGLDAAGNEVTPETRTFIPDAEREQICVDFLKSMIPGALGPILETKPCLYTMTLDRNYVIDSLEARGWPEVVFCCGAGHAYKFASLLGKILSELAIDGRTQYNIKGFSMDRAAITDPDFKPRVHIKVQSKI